MRIPGREAPPEDEAVHWAERLRRLRARSGLTQVALAERLGVSAVTVSRWEQGHHQPSGSLWRRILRLEERGGNGEPATPASPAPAALVGRERELAELVPLLRLPSPRLLTLTGVGGCGKTCLALALAAMAQQWFADGVSLVELAPLVDPSDVPQAVATALGLREQPVRALTDTLADFLRPRERLLVLDNCEHLRAACASLVGALLRSGSRLQVLATSRQPLRVPGEDVRPVPPLDVPARGDSWEEIAATGAARLFAARALSREPDFAITAENADAVAGICRQVEGLPLALELAAGSLHLFSPAQLAAWLAVRSNLVPKRGPGVVARHQTLRATFEWSYVRLSDVEQQVFRQVAVFAGGFSVEAVKAVCPTIGTAGGEDVVTALDQLLDKSLVERQARAGEVRLRLLEPVRQYALAQLQATGEEELARDRHLAWCLALVEEQSRHYPGPEQRDAFDRLERDHDNLRVALQWAHGRGELGLRLAGGLWLFWNHRSYFSEAGRWLDSLLAVTPTLDSPARARALWNAASFAWRRGDYDEVFARCAEAVALAQCLGDPGAAAFARHYQAVATTDRGDLAEALRLHERSLALHHEARNAWGAALALGHLAQIAQQRGESERADELAQRALALFRTTGDACMIALTLAVVGAGWERQGDMDQAERDYREGLRIAAAEGDLSGLCFAFMRLAGAATIRDQLERAARLFGALDAVLDAQAARLPDFYLTYVESHLGVLRERLGEAALERARAEARAMPRADAVALALEEPRDSAGSATTARSLEAEPYADGLSPREIEVLALLAQGSSNRQISRALTISARTVERHIANIYRKIGVNSRASAAVYALQHDLVPRT